MRIGKSSLHKLHRPPRSRGVCEGRQEQRERTDEHARPRHALALLNKDHMTLVEVPTQLTLPHVRDHQRCDLVEGALPVDDGVRSSSAERACRDKRRFRNDAAWCRRTRPAGRCATSSATVTRVARDGSESRRDSVDAQMLLEVPGLIETPEPWNSGYLIHMKHRQLEARDRVVSLIPNHVKFAGLPIEIRGAK